MYSAENNGLKTLAFRALGCGIIVQNVLSFTFTDRNLLSRKSIASLKSGWYYSVKGRSMVNK